jgi:DNA mismatch repair protein MutL
MLRANQPLTMPEMEVLLEELAGSGFGTRCPHGRPVVHRLTRSEIERFFHRS